MTLFPVRFACVFSLATLLSVHAMAEQAYVQVDDSVRVVRTLDGQLQQGQLAAAETTLQQLRQINPADTRLESYQRQIAEAHLALGRQALAKGDMDSASRELAKARSLMPNAPALTDLTSAIEQTRAQDAARAQAVKAQAEAARQAQLAQQQAAQRAALAAAAKAAEQAKAQAAAEAEAAKKAAAKPAPKRAQLIDPKAGSSVIGLEMLDAGDNDSLRQKLDLVAQDVVNFNCQVQIQVRELKDFQWVAALLSARVKRLDSDYPLALGQKLDAQQKPQLLLTCSPK
ncbi:hypothetical protein [Atopomonas sediminilitoris]|uniref:hypothetical protein n=1 Tax=Atopomonas sediminilitoris TaxID=2919919 RepID=UPI001F4E1C44|nr:hypothetical protein [Atopomonas sediminilitoris]MCJ8170492.1 hypothetical protein [Atopomonas sediminilitoris]